MTAGAGAASIPRKHARQVESLITIAAALLAGCGEGAPPIAIDEPSRRERLLASDVQFATDPRTLVEPVFVLTNRGSAPAAVRLTSVGCGCYGLSLDGRDLNAGDYWSVSAGGQVEIRFAVQPSLRAGEMVYEAELEAVCDEQSLRLPIRYLVTTVADVAIAPDIVTHAAGEAGPAGGRYPVHIRRTYRDAESTGAEPACPGLPDSIRVSDWNCSVAAREEAPGLWMDEWNGVLIVDETIQGELPVGPVPVSFEFPATEGRMVHGELTLLFAEEAGIEAPREVHFGRIRPGERRTRRCLLRARDGVPFRVTGVESEHSMVTADIDHDDPASEHWIDLQLHLADPAIEGDAIHCWTDHPGSPAVPIVLSWRNVGETGETLP